MRTAINSNSMKLGANGSRLSRRGFTLLEVILALALCTLLIGLLLMATRTYLRIAEETSIDVERALLARNVLQLVARDLQNVVVPAAQDVSGVSSTAVPDLGQLAGGVGTHKVASGGNGNGSSTGGSSGGSSGSGGGTGGNNSGGGNNGDEGSSESSGSSMSAEVTDSSSLDVPGVYGNQYELVLDIQRMPEFTPGSVAGGGISAAPQRVSWSVASTGMNALTSNSSLTSNDFLGGAASPAASGGLMRQSHPRAVATWSSANGQAVSGQALLPVSNRITAMEFRYFDGTQWLEAWDSGEMAALPVAIEVSILVLSRAEMADQMSGLNGVSPTEVLSSSLSATAEETASVGRIFRRVIYLPLSGMSPTAASELNAESEASDSDDSGSTSNGQTGSGNSRSGGGSSSSKIPSGKLP